MLTYFNLNWICILFFRGFLSVFGCFGLTVKEEKKKERGENLFYTHIRMCSQLK